MIGGSNRMPWRCIGNRYSRQSFMRLGLTVIERSLKLHFGEPRHNRVAAGIDGAKDLPLDGGSGRREPFAWESQRRKKARNWWARPVS